MKPMKLHGTRRLITSLINSLTTLAMIFSLPLANAEPVIQSFADAPVPRAEYGEATRQLTQAYLEYLNKTSELQDLIEKHAEAKKAREALSDKALKTEIQNLKNELDRMNETLRVAVLDLRSDANKLLSRVKIVNGFLKDNNRSEFSELYTLIDDTTTFIRVKAADRNAWKRLSDTEIAGVISEVANRFSQVFERARVGMQAELEKLKSDMEAEASKVQQQIDPIQSEISRIEALAEFVKWSRIANDQYSRYRSASSEAASARQSAEAWERQHRELSEEKGAIDYRLSQYSRWISDAQSRQSSARSRMSDASSRLSTLRSRQSELQSRLREIESRCSSMSFAANEVRPGRRGGDGNGRGDDGDRHRPDRGGDRTRPDRDGGHNRPDQDGGNNDEEERRRREEEQRRREEERRRREEEQREERRRQCMQRAEEVKSRLSEVNSQISMAESEYSSAQSELSDAEAQESRLRRERSNDESRLSSVEREISQASRNASHYRSQESEQESIAANAYRQYTHADQQLSAVKVANDYDTKVSQRNTLLRKKAQFDDVARATTKQSKYVDEGKTETEQSMAKVNDLHARKGQLPAVIAEKERILREDLPRQQAEADAKVAEIVQAYAQMKSALPGLQSNVDTLNGTVANERKIFADTMAGGGQKLPHLDIRAATKRWAVEKVGVHPAFEKAACIAHGDEMLTESSIVARMEIVGLKDGETAKAYSEATLLLETMTGLGDQEIPRATNVIMSVYRQNPQSTRSRTVAAKFELSELAAVEQSFNSQLKQVFAFSLKDRDLALNEMKNRWIAKLDFVYGGQIIATIPEFSFSGVTAALKNEMSDSSGVCNVKWEGLGKYQDRLK